MTVTNDCRLYVRCVTQTTKYGTTEDYERGGGGEGNNTQRFSCFHHSSQKCKVSFACDLIFKTMNKFFQVTDFIVFVLFTYCLI